MLADHSTSGARQTQLCNRRDAKLQQHSLRRCSTVDRRDTLRTEKPSEHCRWPIADCRLIGARLESLDYQDTLLVTQLQNGSEATGVNLDRTQRSFASKEI